MKENQLKTKEITTIGVGIAAMIAGGAVIYQISMVMPIPGFKYMIMAPYLSMIIYILLVKIGTKSALLHIGLVFGLIMIVMNVYMSLSIVLTTVLTDLSIRTTRDPQKRAVIGSALFSSYTGVVALLVSKYLIGGVFMQISIIWILCIGIMCLALGIVGTVLARKIMVQISMYSYR